MNQSRSRKATILIVGPVPPPYHGVSVVTQLILESKIKDKYQVSYLNTTDQRNIKNIGKFDFFNAYLAAKHVYDLLNILGKTRTDIVYLPVCQSVKGLLRDAAFLSLAKMKRAKCIIHLHGGYFKDMYEKANLLGKLLVTYVCKLTSRAIVLGETLRRMFEGLVPDEKIVVIPNGIGERFIEESDLKEKLANEFDNSTVRNKHRILFLSNLTISKGFYDTMQAIPEVVKNHPDTEFIFAGEWWDDDVIKDEITKFMHEKRITERVQFPGVITGEAKKKMLLLSDIFVFPTHYKYEGQPLVIIEAMSAGLPVITTDQGCIREMVVDGETGFIIEKQNPVKIAEKILVLLKDRDLRKRMGMNGRARFLKYYTKKRFVADLIRVFDHVLTEQ